MYEMSGNVLHEKRKKPTVRQFILINLEINLFSSNVNFLHFFVFLLLVGVVVMLYIVATTLI